IDLRGELGPGTTLADLVWAHRPERTPMPATAADVPTTSPESAALAAELKRRGFRFVGPTTMFALMEALGVVDTHLLGSHRRGSSGVWAADAPPVAERHTPSQLSLPGAWPTEDEEVRTAQSEEKPVSTDAIHAGWDPAADGHRALTPPVHTASAYAQTSHAALKALFQRR